MSSKLSTYKTPIIYFLTVLVGYCIDFSIYAGLVNCQVPIYLANVVGFCIGSITNTLLIRCYVFRDSKFSLVNDIYLSITANALVFAIGMGFIWFLVDLLNMNPYGAKLLANGVTFIANFFMRASFFRNK